MMLEDEEKISFEDEIYPILKKKCVSCHGPDRKKNGKIKKASSGLRLDSLTGIMRGGEGGSILTKGNPEKSSLYTLTVLDPDDMDIMPSKGEPLSKKQTELIRKWILEGADFGDWVGVSLGKHKAQRSISESPFNKVVSMLEKSSPVLPKGVVSKLQKAGFVIHPLAKDSNLLDVDLRYSKVLGNLDNLKKLKTVYRNIHTLNLSKTDVDDSVFAELSQCKNLVRLNLSSTKITGKGVGQLKECKHLESLNISNTAFDKKHLSKLKVLSNLNKIYYWNTILDHNMLYTTE